jgi:capsular polysaccharide export protein
MKKDKMLKTLYLTPEMQKDWPHLQAFFPDCSLASGHSRPAAALTLPPLQEGAWVAPSFNGIRRPIALLAPFAPPALPAAPEAVRAAWRDAFAEDPPETLLDALPHNRFACPFTQRPISAEAAVAILALWRRIAAENRQIGSFLGMAGWKQPAITSAFGPAPFAKNPATALAHPGKVLAWASSLTPATEAAAGERLWRVEDGFIRSLGLGVNFAPAASLVIDRLGMHYDPARPSQLEKILTETQFPPALLARAAALRARITAANITKYNLAETPLTLPATPGRRRILVVGQVEDDASIRHGAGRVRSNAHLLAAARAVEPHAFIIYKPHPDVQTGYRRGYLPAREARRHADMVVTTGNIGTLLAQVHALHTITSLAGFEALLRGLAVTTWGAPFYTGWGLTDDHEPPPRRSRRLSLDALVAGCLILYPRYQDPVTRLPCPPELLLDRLAEPSLWPPLPPARRAYLAWWRLQGQMLKFARATGLWRR